jgi:hypothetical protein
MFAEDWAAFEAEMAAAVEALAECVGTAVRAQEPFSAPSTGERVFVLGGEVTGAPGAYSAPRYVSPEQAESWAVRPWCRL